MKRLPSIPAAVAAAVVFLTSAMGFAQEPDRGGTGRATRRGCGSSGSGPVEPAPAVLSIRAHARPDRLQADQGTAPHDAAGARRRVRPGDRPDRRVPPRGPEIARPARRTDYTAAIREEVLAVVHRHATPEQLSACRDDLRLAGGGPPGSRDRFPRRHDRPGAAPRAGGSASRSPVAGLGVGCPLVRRPRAGPRGTTGHPGRPRSAPDAASEPEPAGSLASPAEIQESPLGRRHRSGRRPGDGAGAGRDPKTWSRPVRAYGVPGRLGDRAMTTDGPVRPERPRASGIRMKRIAHHLAWLLGTAALLVSAAAVAGRLAWAQQPAGRSRPHRRPPRGGGRRPR